MKTKAKKPKETKSLRLEILASMQASFRIEGINISNEMATNALQKVELTLEK
jgi:hypothetical protein